MIIYLAARYSRRVELCGYRDQLIALGHHIPAVWLNGSHQISDDGKPLGEQGEKLVEGDEGSQSEKAAALRAKFAQDDVNDVMNADCIINFTEPPRSSASRGGRHVEFGILLGVELLRQRHCPSDPPTRRLIVVGHRENIFHWLPCVEFYPTWEECLAQLTAERNEHG